MLCMLTCSERAAQPLQQHAQVTSALCPGEQEATPVFQPVAGDESGWMGWLRHAGQLGPIRDGGRVNGRGAPPGLQDADIQGGDQGARDTGWRQFYCCQSA